MVTFSINCPICDQQMRFLYTEWKSLTGNRYCNRYGCRNGDCKSHDLCGAYVLFPEMRTQDYLLGLKFQESVYYIFSDKKGTALYKGHEIETVLMVDRAYPIDMNLNLNNQIKDIFSKLQTLILFS